MKNYLCILFFICGFQSALAQVENINIKYPNGKTSETGTFVDGKKNGPFITYFENAKVKSSSNYVFGKRNGVQKEFYDNGQLKAEANLVNDVYHGLNRLYYKDGKLQLKVKYKNGIRDGKLVSYNEKGVLTEKKTYKNGKWIGERVSYYDNGQIRNKSVFDKKGNFIKSEAYFKNGKQMYFSAIDKKGNGESYNVYANDSIRERTYLKEHKVWKEERFEENGKRTKITEFNPDGTYKNIKSFDENGLLEIDTDYENHSPTTSTTYKNGLIEKANHKKGYKDGLFEVFYPDGTLAESGHYFKSEKVGKWKSYYNDGALQFIGNFVKTGNRGNFKDSIHTYYYPSGQIEKIENYSIAKIIRTANRPDDFYERTHKTGIWKSFYESGRLSEVSNYNENELNGEQVQYFDQDDHNLKYKATYRNRIKVGEEISYYTTGKIYTLKNWNNQGYKSGKEVTYRTDGSIEQSTDYFENIKHGDFAVNYEDGKPKIIGKFDRGMESGNWIYYYKNGNVFKKVNYKTGIQEKQFYYNDGIKFAHVVLDKENYKDTYVFYDKTGKISSAQNIFNSECDNCQITDFDALMDLDGMDINFITFKAKDGTDYRYIGRSFSFSSLNHK